MKLHTKFNLKQRRTAVAAATLLAAGAVGVHLGCNKGGGGGAGGIGSISNSIAGALGGGSRSSSSSGGGNSLIGGTIGTVTGNQAAGNLFDAGTNALQASSINAAQEDAMGQGAAVTLTNKNNLVKDKKLSKYVSLVGLTVVDASPRPVGNWVFGVLDTDEVNAYAGPNGYIFVTRGALEKMEDESELAGVLAHEITHVLHHHGLEGIKFEATKGVGLAALGAFSKDARNFSQVIDLGADVLVSKPYGRTQELDADKTAVQLVTAAGYDPNGYARFLTRLQGGGFFSTHPGTEERLSAVQQQINQSGARGGATLRERFQRNVRPSA